MSWCFYGEVKFAFVDHEKNSGNQYFWKYKTCADLDCIWSSASVSTSVVQRWTRLCVVVCRHVSSLCTPSIVDVVNTHRDCVLITRSSAHTHAHACTHTCTYTCTHEHVNRHIELTLQYTYASMTYNNYLQTTVFLQVYRAIDFDSHTTCRHVHMHTCTHVHMYSCTHAHMYTSK